MKMPLSILEISRTPRILGLPAVSLTQPPNFRSVTLHLSQAGLTPTPYWPLRLSGNDPVHMAHPSCCRFILTTSMARCNPRLAWDAPGHGAIQKPFPGHQCRAFSTRLTISAADASIALQRRISTSRVGDF